MNRTSTHQWSARAGVVPSLGIAVLSKFTCSLCLTAYAGVLSSLGVGLLSTDRGLLIFTAVLVALNLLSLGWSTWRHKHWGPLALALLGSAVLLIGRIWSPTPTILYGGALLLLVAAGWNLWTARQPKRALVQISSIHMPELR